jgi:type I restriction enzyme R subunit
MPPSNFTYDQSAIKPSHVVTEEQIEYGFVGKLQGLKNE